MINKKTEKNILIAFLLNLFFAIFEFIGGILTNSVAIASDAIHDLGDALSIGISYILEKKSKKKPDDKYTFGYIRFSVLGGVITTLILLIGACIVIYNAILRLFNPVEIDYSGMVLFAIIGVVVNFVATYTTKGGNSINQKSVNLHMLEDVFGWIIVLIGAIIMRFTNISYIDSIMSIAVSIFIFMASIKNLKEVLDIFLEKIPRDVNIEEIKTSLLKINGVDDIHHIHVWSIDGYNNYATMHIVSKSDNIKFIKHEIKDKLKDFNICHTILETEDEMCDEIECNPVSCHEGCEHKHHHHH